jgi:hypothetical protein
LHSIHRKPLDSSVLWATVKLPETENAMEGKMSRTIVNPAGTPVAHVFSAGTSNPALPAGRCIRFYMTAKALEQCIGMGVREETSTGPFDSFERWLKANPAASYLFAPNEAMMSYASIEVMR